MEKSKKRSANENMRLANRLMNHNIAVANAVDKSGDKISEEYENFKVVTGVLDKEERSSFLLGYALVTSSTQLANSLKTMKLLESMGIRYGQPRMMEVFEPYEELGRLMPDEKFAAGYIEYYFNVIRMVNATRETKNEG